MQQKTRIVERVLFLLVLILGASVATATAAAPAAQPALCPAPEKAMAAGPVTVQGWVINHREQAVDGARTAPPLELTAVGSDGAVVNASVASNGYFQLSLTPDVWDFQMQLPEGWDGIVPQAGRAELARTGCTALPGRSQPYLIVFKIRRLFDVTALKWEELANGTVQPGQSWAVSFRPVNDPFAIAHTVQTGASGAATAALTPGTWYIFETVKPGWTPVTPAGVWITLDQYAPAGAMDPVVFKNRIVR